MEFFIFIAINYSYFSDVAQPGIFSNLLQVRLHGNSNIRRGLELAGIDVFDDQLMETDIPGYQLNRGDSIRRVLQHHQHGQTLRLRVHSKFCFSSSSILNQFNLQELFSFMKPAPLPVGQVRRVMPGFGDMLYNRTTSALTPRNLILPPTPPVNQILVPPPQHQLQQRRRQLDLTGVNELCWFMLGFLACVGFSHEFARNSRTVDLPILNITSDSGVNFYYYKGYQLVPSKILMNAESLLNTDWDYEIPVKFLVHGFMSSYRVGSSLVVREAYAKANGKFNVIVVDWESLAAAPDYFSAANATKFVGEETGNLMYFLVQQGFSKENKIHGIGHSLGAHVVGFAGARFQFLSGGMKIGRITGLDPAFPCFEDAGEDDRLDSSDATFVDVIHTNGGSLLGGKFGTLEPIGHIDFYPNGGTAQPGCVEFMSECSHARASVYFAESVTSKQFVSCKCHDDAWNGYFGFSSSSCSCEKGIVSMGEHLSPNETGIYYLETNSAAPWSKGR